MFIKEKLAQFLPSYTLVLKDMDWYICKDVPYLDDVATITIGMTYDGLFVVQDEPVYLINMDGEYDIDFLIESAPVHADTFSKLESDFRTFKKIIGRDR